MSRFIIKKNYLFLVLIILILGATTGVAAIAMQTDKISEAIGVDQLIKAIVVLKDDKGEIVFTNVFICYPTSKRGALFDIPSNIGCLNENLKRVGRIDTVYQQLGMEAYKAELEKLMGTSIPFTIEMDINQFSDLTDLLGGIKVFIPSAVDIIDNDVRYMLPSGSVNLDGDKARIYLEYSDSSDRDSDLNERKQKILVALLYSLSKKSSAVFSKTMFPKIASKFTTNVDDKSLKKLLFEISSVDVERLVPQTITGSEGTTADGIKLIFPYYDGQLIKDIVKKASSNLTSEGDSANSRIYVLDIKNGTNTKGLAKNTSSLFKSFGYEILGVSNADKSDYEKTLIIDHIGDNDVATNLGSIIRCSNIETEAIDESTDVNDANSLVDFTIIIGKDFDGRYVR